jgi:hypothetical protein
MKVSVEVECDSCMEAVIEDEGRELKPGEHKEFTMKPTDFCEVNGFQMFECSRCNHKVSVFLVLKASE